jgi:hypothetical protein
MQTIINAIKSITNSNFMNTDNSFNVVTEDHVMVNYFKTEFKNNWRNAYYYYKTTGNVPKGNNW